MNQDKLNELRDYYDNTDVANEFTDAAMETHTTDEVMVSTSIRLPQSLVDKVRTQAAALGIPATTLRSRTTTFSPGAFAPKVGVCRSDQAPPSPLPYPERK